MDERLSIIAGTMSLLSVGLVAMIGVLVYMQNSLVSATNELLVCERSGGIECHIERDWTNYNVYSY